MEISGPQSHEPHFKGSEARVAGGDRASEERGHTIPVESSTGSVALELRTYSGVGCGEGTTTFIFSPLTNTNM